MKLIILRLIQSGIGKNAPETFQYNPFWCSSTNCSLKTHYSIDTGWGETLKVEAHKGSSYSRASVAVYK